MALSGFYGSFMPLLATQGFCQSYYGWWPDSGDCVNAVRSLEKGSDSVTYTVDRDSGPHALPLNVKSGKCMVQVEVAGPRYPPTIEFVPSDIRSMAEYVIGTCVKDGTYYGGFMTSDLAGLCRKRGLAYMRLTLDLLQC